MLVCRTTISPIRKYQGHHLSGSRLSRSQVAFITAEAFFTIDHINTETLTFRKSTIEFLLLMAAETIVPRVAQVVVRVVLNTVIVTTRTLVNMHREVHQKQHQPTLPRLMSRTELATSTSSQRKTCST